MDLDGPCVKGYRYCDLFQLLYHTLVVLCKYVHNLLRDIVSKVMLYLATLEAYSSVVNTAAS